MKIDIHRIATVSLLSLAVATAGCGADTTTSEAQPTTDSASSDTQEVTGEVNVYSSRHYDTDEALYDNFTQETGIEVNLLEGSADELVERIEVEGQNSPADVLITVDIGRLWRAREAGILQPTDSEVLSSAIAANLRSPEGYWYGLSKRARVIVYSQERVDRSELSSYRDLASPQWDDRLCVRSSENIYNQSLVAAKIEAWGVETTEEWVSGLVDNFARPPQGNDTAQIEAIASGECDVALVNHYYYARLVQSDDPQDEQIVEDVGIFFPEDTHINISGAGVAAYAPNRENAIRFIEYLATPEAQKIYANANNEFPANDEVDPNKTIADLGELKESDLDIAAYGENNPEAVRLMDRAGWQ